MEDADFGLDGKVRYTVDGEQFNELGTVSMVEASMVLDFVEQEA